jgi:glyoxylase-like metal-dependent hydrolase (beta-lactamase superfamily II)
MLVDQPGKITKRITLLGRRESCVYHVDGGREGAILGGGMSMIAEDVLRQIREFGIDEKKIARLIILHSHFDHCGAIPFFKRQWPWARVTASRRARELLSDPKVTENIRTLNQVVISKAGLEGKAKEKGYEFTSIQVEDTIKEGDLLKIGDLTLEAIDVPGHSSCSVAFYLPEEKALFASDAGGIRYGDFFLAAGNSNYDLYEKGLEKMSRFDGEAVLGEHYGASLGEDARDFFAKSIASAKKTRELLEASLRRTGDAKKTEEEVTDYMMKEVKDYFLSRTVISLVTAQMVRYFAKKMAAGPAR